MATRNSTFVLASLFLAACGGGGSDSPAPAVSATPIAQAPAAQAPIAAAPAPVQPAAPAPVAPTPQPPAAQPPAAPTPAPQPPAPPPPNPARTLQYSYPTATLKCGRNLKWYPIPEQVISYDTGKMIVRDPRAPNNALTFQLDSAAEKQEYSGSTGWFQTALGYRSWLIVDLNGAIVGAGYHQNIESSYVQCGVSLVDSQRDPASILPQTTQPLAVRCSENGTRIWTSTLYMRDGLLYSTESDRTVVPLNGIKFSDGAGHVEAGGGGYFSFQSPTNASEYIGVRNGQLTHYQIYPGRSCYAI